MENHKIISFSISCIWLLILGSPTLWAQSDARIEAERQIRSLKEGKLLVIIPSQLKTLNELYRLSKSEELSAQQITSLKLRYDKTIAKRDSFHKELAAAFDTTYNFSDYGFIYDYQLRSQAPEENFAKAPPLRVEGLDSFTHRLRIGKTRSAEQFGVQAIIVTDGEGNDLADPFPYYVKLNKKTWLSGLFSIFNPDGYKRKSGEELVDRLNEKLNKFYSKVVSGS